MAVRPVILSGGAGTRMWPVSRARFPKQFADLYGDMCLFARTLELVADRDRFAAPLIIANKDHKFLILDAPSRLNIHDAIIMLEPVGRNTGAAAIVAALQDCDHEMFHLVLPSDHVITEHDEFYHLIGEVQKSAGHFTLFGIRPDHPETGFGYIVSDAAGQAGESHAIKTFIEKPNEAKARALIDEGALWNSGIFCYQPQTLLSEVEILAPESLRLCREALAQSSRDFGCIMLAEQPYEELDNQPFDKMVMEKTDKGLVIPASFGWSDVGTWQALWQMEPKDAAQNVVHGPVIADDVQASYLDSHGPTLAVLGVENLVVVATKDAVLVAPRRRSQDIPAIVAQLPWIDGGLALEHPRVMRPWGCYEGVASGARFQVKRITVLPGRALSLQKHLHRAEHWVVVAGTARVECDGVESLLHPNQSLFIPQGAVHRLSNPGPVDLELIEVQSGDYLGEDDIVRFSDPVWTRLEQVKEELIDDDNFGEEQKPAQAPRAKRS